MESAEIFYRSVGDLAAETFATAVTQERRHRKFSDKPVHGAAISCANLYTKCYHDYYAGRLEVADLFDKIMRLQLEKPVTPGYIVSMLTTITAKLCTRVVVMDLCKIPDDSSYASVVHSRACRELARMMPEMLPVCTGTDEIEVYDPAAAISIVISDTTPPSSSTS